MIFDPILSKNLYSLDSTDGLCIGSVNFYPHRNDASNSSPGTSHDGGLSYNFFH